MQKNNLNSEEKLDRILKYTRRAYHWEVLRGIISFLFFLIFFVLPLIGGFYFFNYFKENVDWSKWNDMKKQFQEFQGFDFQNFGAQIKEFQSLMKPPSR